MKIAYLRPEKVDPASNDGGDIYHRKLLAELDRRADRVEEIVVAMTPRKTRLPLWSQRIAPRTLARLGALAEDGCTVIVAHENIFDLAAHSAALGCPTHLLVHNYLARFRFAGRPLLSLAYRLGAHRYYERAFAASRGAVFLGVGDFTAASARHRSAPERAVRFLLAQIPPAPIDVDYAFDPAVMHLAGSEVWLPKRLSRLAPTERERLERHLTTGEYAELPRSGFTLITDRFDVGFKLKLMQALHVGDFILSRVDLGAEIRAISPHYRWFRTFTDVDDVLRTVEDVDVQRDMRRPERAALARQVSRDFSWERHGEAVFALLGGAASV